MRTGPPGSLALGPVGPPGAGQELKLVKRLTPLTGEGYGWMGEKGARDSHKEEEKEGGSGTGEGA